MQAGRVVRALRLSSRPPKAGAPIPGDVATQLAEATAASLTSDTGPDRWATVLDALAYSPVRRRVIPQSLPEKLHPELKATIARLASRLPEIAHIFDIEPDPAAERAARNANRRGGRKGDDRGKGGKPGKGRGDRDRGRGAKGGRDGKPGEKAAGSPQGRSSDKADAKPAAPQADAPATEPPQADARDRGAATEAPAARRTAGRRPRDRDARGRRTAGRGAGDRGCRRRRDPRPRHRPPRRLRTPRHRPAISRVPSRRRWTRPLPMSNEAGDAEAPVAEVTNGSAPPEATDIPAADVGTGSNDEATPGEAGSAASADDAVRTQ